jgi:hypothetical protein
VIGEQSSTEVRTIEVLERHGAVGGGGLSSAWGDGEAVRVISEDVADHDGFVGHHQDLASDCGHGVRRFA